MLTVGPPTCLNVIFNSGRKLINYPPVGSSASVTKEAAEDSV